MHKSIFLLFVAQPELKCLVVQLAMLESCSWGHFILTSPCNTWTIVVCSLSEEGIRQKQFQRNGWHFIVRTKKSRFKNCIYFCVLLSCCRVGSKSSYNWAGRSWAESGRQRIKLHSESILIQMIGPRSKVQSIITERRQPAVTLELYSTSNTTLLTWKEVEPWIWKLC